MDDEALLALFWRRDPEALTQLQSRYGSYCRKIAGQILQSELDAQECENDAYLRVWDAIPPQRPANLRLFLGAVVRNLAINRAVSAKAARRGGGRVQLALDELAESLPGGSNPEQEVDAALLGEAMRRFLQGLSQEERVLFLRRYWRLDSTAQLPLGSGLSESGVRSRLCRTRKKLKKFLEREGYTV